VRWLHGGGSYWAWLMIYCGTCGHGLPDSARFCDNCGTPKSPAAAEPSHGAPPDGAANSTLASSGEPAEVAQIAVAASESLNKTVIGAVLGVLVVVVVGWFAVRRDTSDPLLITSADPGATSASTVVDVSTTVDPGLAIPITPLPTVSATTIAATTVPLTSILATTVPSTTAPPTTAPPPTAPPPTVLPGPGLPAFTQTCHNDVEGYSFTYPEGWFIADGGMLDLTCSLFDPLPFDVVVDAEFPITAVMTFVSYEDLDTFASWSLDPSYATVVVGPVEVEIAGHRAIITELEHTPESFFGAGALTYEIWMDVGGRTMTLMTLGPGPDYELNRMVVDAMALNLVMD